MGTRWNVPGVVNSVNYPVTVFHFSFFSSGHFLSSPALWHARYPLAPS